MAKPKTSYFCNACGAESSQWFGKCPSCGTYNSLDEQVTTAPGNSTSRNGWQSQPRGNSKSPKSPQPRASIKFADITERDQPRWASGYGELDRVLGGGIVPGSLVLIGGDPGIGKSTLLLQVANSLSENFRILYVSGEESGQQIKLRASRLGVGNAVEEDLTDYAVSSSPDTASENGHVTIEADVSLETSSEIVTKPATSDRNLYALAETDLEEILKELESLKPHVAVIDSIQTVYFSSLTSAPGSVSQVRECTSALMQVAKREDITLLIVGHVTKEGAIARTKSAGTFS